MNRPQLANMQEVVESQLKSLARCDQRKALQQPIRLLLRHSLGSIVLIDQRQRQFSVYDHLLASFQGYFWDPKCTILDHTDDYVHLHGWSIELEFTKQGEVQKILIYSQSVRVETRRQRMAILSGVTFFVVFCEKENEIEKLTKEKQGYLNRLKKRIRIYGNIHPKCLPKSKQLKLIRFVPKRKVEYESMEIEPMHFPEDSKKREIAELSTEDKALLDKLSHFISASDVCQFTRRHEKILSARTVSALITFSLAKAFEDKQDSDSYQTLSIPANDK